jgi:hypothetical protein
VKGLEGGSEETRRTHRRLANQLCDRAVSQKIVYYEGSSCDELFLGTPFVGVEGRNEGGEERA